MNTSDIEVLKIMKIDKIENGIRIMLHTAQCVYFYKFGLTIYTETDESIKKKTFDEFKKDIKNFDWNIEKLELNWINKKN